MKDFTKIALTALIFLIAGWLLRKPNIDTGKGDTTYVTYDTTIVNNTYLPQPENIERTNWLKTIKYIDTSYIDEAFFDSIMKYASKKELVAVADNFFKRKYYSDTIKDSLYSVTIEDSVYMNSLVWRNLNVQLINKNTVITKRNRGFVGAGAFVGYSKDFYALGGVVNYTTKNNLSFGYGYSPLNSYHFISVSSKISLRKK